MGKVTHPFHLVVARVNGKLDVAGLPHKDAEGEADALRRELDRDDGSIAYVADHTDHEVEHYEVYVIGRGNRKSPAVFNPGVVKRWREEDRGPLAP